MGPSTSTNSSSTTASSRLVSDRMRMPRSSPLATEIVASPQLMTMRMICVGMPTGTPNRWFRPLLICATPRPSDVATPNTVPMMAKMSTAWPIGP
ncbi:Uncharacterised protein [Bordetella pertussis]|nr:Uncharacterised protein [Bordetella pertussis]